MEDAKLQALHDTLCRLSGKSGRGLGISSLPYSWSQKNANESAGPRTDGLPNNALYANFVKEGNYNPNNSREYGDGRVIIRDFSDIDDPEEEDRVASTNDSNTEIIKEKKKSKEERKQEKKAARKAAKLEAKRQAKLEEKMKLKKEKKKAVSTSTTSASETNDIVNESQDSLETRIKKEKSKLKKTDSVSGDGDKSPEKGQRIKKIEKEKLKEQEAKAQLPLSHGVTSKSPKPKNKCRINDKASKKISKDAPSSDIVTERGSGLMKPKTQDAKKQKKAKAVNDSDAAADLADTVTSKGGKTVPASSEAKRKVSKTVSNVSDSKGKKLKAEDSNVVEKKKKRKIESIEKESETEREKSSKRRRK